jgi:hypothetical protein
MPLVGLCSTTYVISTHFVRGGRVALDYYRRFDGASLSSSEGLVPIALCRSVPLYFSVEDALPGLALDDQRPAHDRDLRVNEKGDGAV